MKIRDFPFTGSTSFPSSQRVLEPQSCFPSNPPSMKVRILLTDSLGLGVASFLPLDKNIIKVSIKKNSQTNLIHWLSFLRRHPIKTKVHEGSYQIHVHNLT